MEPYKICDFEDEKAWLKGRLNGIGGSDASAVVGKNPYKTNIELFEEKTGRRIAPDISEKPYVIYETILEDVLKRLIRIIIRLGIVTGNTLDQNTDIVIDFDDSIIEDKGAERQQDRQDVSMGVMRHEEYRAKWYGETVEQAKKNLPEQNQVME